MLREAMETRGVLPAKDTTKQGLEQLVDKGCFHSIDKSEIIMSQVKTKATTVQTIPER